MFTKFRNKPTKLFLSLKTFKNLYFFIDNELIIHINFTRVKNFLSLLRKHCILKYEILSDLSAIDYIYRRKRFEVFYNLLSLKQNNRIRVVTHVNNITPIYSVTNIYKNAGWLEREVWDMYGIFFLGHNDLRRILTDYGFKGHPLRKDFPLTGFLEVKYYFPWKRIIWSPVGLEQAFRMFQLKKETFPNTLI